MLHLQKALVGRYTPIGPAVHTVSLPALGLLQHIQEGHPGNLALGTVCLYVVLILYTAYLMALAPLTLVKEVWLAGEGQFLFSILLRPSTKMCGLPSHARSLSSGYSILMHLDQ